jgi:hypothetical protein
MYRFKNLYLAGSKYLNFFVLEYLVKSSAESGKALQGGRDGELKSDLHPS